MVRETVGILLFGIGNVGKGLSGEDGGSEGEGRQVFSYISKIRSFYFLTIRKDDPENKLLMGLSFLRPHEIAGKTYESIGRCVIGKVIIKMIFVYLYLIKQMHHRI